MKLSDQGNAQRLIDHCGHTYKYVALQDKWVKWTGGTWEPDTKGEIVQRAKELSQLIREDANELLRQSSEADDESSAKYLSRQAQTALDWARQSEQAATIMNAVKLAETEQPVLPDEFDRDPYLLNCPNGVLDLRDRTIRPPSAEMLLTKSVKVAYQPKAHSELWCNFLHTLTGGDVELQHYLQRCFGYALLGEWREKSFWFGYGVPDGGKTTFLSAIHGVLGSYSTAADSTTWMIQQGIGGNRGDIVRLLGARLVISSEVKPGMVFDPKLVKQVTGGDTIVAAAKYESEIAFTPQFALWMAGNERPRVNDTDDGMWRRLVCVPFNNAVKRSQQDPQLGAKLAHPDVSAAILAWMVDGYGVYVAEGIGSCKAVEDATAEYKRTMNPMLTFCEDCLVYTGNDADTIRGSDLQSCYLAWCKLNQIRQPVGPRNVAHGIQEYGGVRERDMKGSKWLRLKFTSEAQELSW